MTTTNANALTNRRPNGAGASAVLSAGIGIAVLGILTIAGDKSTAIKSTMIFYKPTGPLSGVTTISIFAWLISWVILHVVWSKREVSLKPIVYASFAMLVLGLLLTFPPFIDAI